MNQFNYFSEAESGEQRLDMVELIGYVAVFVGVYKFQPAYVGLEFKINGIINNNQIILKAPIGDVFDSVGDYLYFL